MVQKKQDLKWIDSEGGPLILLPQNLLDYWLGIIPPSDDRQIRTTFQWDPNGLATDYDRACDVQGYVEPLEVAFGHALVLGNEPFSTTWWPISNDTGGILVRWVEANDVLEVTRALEALPISLFPKPKISIQFSDQTLYLFDSATPGTEVPDNIHLKITLNEGVYSVSTFEYKPSNTVWLILHRLHLASS